jgi:hypothetical protein
MRGIPTYTQYTVAFPTLPFRDSVIEEIGVSFDAKGGGTHGEFTFRWYDFGGMHPYDKRDHRALRVEAFTDGGISAMLDDRLLSILRRLSRRRRDIPEVTPDTLVQMLEEVGVRASVHQLRGLYAESYGRPEYWPAEARRAYQTLMRHERGS